MSRSIHQTRRDVEEMRRWDYADNRRRNEDLWLVKDGLSQKRRYKERVQHARRRSADAVAPSIACLVTIEEPHQFVHHPLTVADVEGLLGRLSADVRPIVRAIRLRSGILEDDMRGDGSEQDPLTGRHGFQAEGGIWVPALLGRYRVRPCEIDLFGFVYDAASLRVPEVVSLLLWLRQALTFAHEVAHCWDYERRMARDRWAPDDDYRVERYADESAHAWLIEAAVPYFRQQYPRRVHNFETWVERHVGIPVTLERVAEDADRSMWGAVEGLLEVCAKWNEAEELDLRVELAEQLHYVEDFGPAAEIVAGVLRHRPRHAGATILLGDIAVHQEDWPRALEWTALAVQRAPDDEDGHIDRINALMGARDWSAAVAACNTALRLAQLAKPTRAGIRLERARSQIELGDFTAANEDLEAVITDGPRFRARAAEAVRAECLVRQSRWAQARKEALKALRSKPPTWPQAILTAAAWESSRHLNERDPRPVPTQRQLELLRANGRAPWAERLLALGLKPAIDRPTLRRASLTRSRGPLVRL